MTLQHITIGSVTCVILCDCWLSGCRSQCNGCTNVVRRLCWRESSGTKPCVFPCAVASAGDGSYLVCVRRVRAGVGVVRTGCFDVFCVFFCIAVRCCFGTCGCETHCTGWMNVAWGLCWAESRSTKPCVFPCKVAKSRQNVDNSDIVSNSCPSFLPQSHRKSCTVARLKASKPSRLQEAPIKATRSAKGSQK